MIDFSSLNPVVATLSLLAFLAVLWFALARGSALMMFFQQEEYDNTRFTAWLKDKKAYDKSASGWLMMAALVSAVLQSDLSAALREQIVFLTTLPLALFAVGILRGIRLSAIASKNNKKPLVHTDRVKRITRVYSLLILAVTALIFWLASFAPIGSSYSVSYEENAESWLDSFEFLSLTHDWRFAAITALIIGLFQLLPFFIVTANKLLEPFEERVKAKFRAEAVKKFNRLSPKVIAITGSFGKTSTKHILAHILEAAAPTLATPGSVNTEMGITRVIREKLTADHQFFIVEMGAYGPGSIARLCRLTPPDVSLITAVGAAHYERFKTIDTVAKAKFEIAEAVFKEGGKAIISTDGIPAKYIAERTNAVPGDYTRVGTEGDVQIKGHKITKVGLVIEVVDGGEDHTITAPLYGHHQAENIVMAAATARAVGLPWSAIKGALATVPQIRFRLEVSRSHDAPTLINDAYNSNPVGFAAALECLDILVKPKGRRTLVTPGMVELGALHEAEHERLGALTAQHTDIVCVVTPDRIPSFVKGLEANNDGSTTVMTFSNQEDAENWVKANWKAEDAVLFENNLPDLYEATVKF